MGGGAPAAAADGLMASREMIAPVTLRAVTPSDVPAIAAIERRAFSDPWPSSASSTCYPCRTLGLQPRSRLTGHCAGTACCCTCSTKGKLRTSPSRRNAVVAALPRDCSTTRSRRPAQPACRRCFSRSGCPMRRRATSTRLGGSNQWDVGAPIIVRPWRTRWSCAGSAPRSPALHPFRTLQRKEQASVARVWYVLRSLLAFPTTPAQQH